MTAEHTHHWRAHEPCGHVEHPGKFINDWTDKERGAFLVGQKMAHAELARLRAEIVDWEERYTDLLDTLTGLRAELQTWQQRFGDCEATVLTLNRVIEDALQIAVMEGRDLLMEPWASLAMALDAVPRRAGTVHSPEREKAPKHCPGCGHDFHSAGDCRAPDAACPCSRNMAVYLDIPAASPEATAP